jgi:hypothetical protein
MFDLFSSNADLLFSGKRRPLMQRASKPCAQADLVPLYVRL